MLGADVREYLTERGFSVDEEEWVDLQARMMNMSQGDYITYNCLGMNLFAVIVPKGVPGYYSVVIMNRAVLEALIGSTAKSLSEANELIEKLKMENDTLRVMNDALQSNHSEVAHYNMKLHEDNEVLKNANKALRNDCAEVSKDNVEFRKDIAKLREDNESLKSEATNFETANHALRGKNSALQKQNAELLESNAKLLEITEELKKQNCDLHDDVRAHRIEIDNLKRSELPTDPGYVKQLEELNEAFKSRLSDVSNDNDRLCKENGELTKRVQDLEYKENKFFELRSSYCNQIEQLRKERGELTKRIHNLESHIKDANHKCDRILKDCGVWRSKYELLREAAIKVPSSENKALAFVTVESSSGDDFEKELQKLYREGYSVLNSGNNPEAWWAILKSDSRGE